jgi:hypothetical protein
MPPKPTLPSTSSASTPTMARTCSSGRCGIPYAPLQWPRRFGGSVTT